jgi:hypothetical protein
LDRLPVEFNDGVWFVVDVELWKLWCFNFGDGGDVDVTDAAAAGDAVNFDDGKDV